MKKASLILTAAFLLGGLSYAQNGTKTATKKAEPKKEVKKTDPKAEKKADTKTSKTVKTTK